MAINIDPLIINWPQKWLNDPEIGPVVAFLDKYLTDLRDRTGGATDVISTTSDSSSNNTATISSNAANISTNSASISTNSEEILYLISQISALNAKLAVVQKKLEDAEDLIWLRT